MQASTKLNLTPEIYQRFRDYYEAHERNFHRFFFLLEDDGLDIKDVKHTVALCMEENQYIGAPSAEEVELSKLLAQMSPTQINKLSDRIVGRG